jgi:hypothetical protein
VKQIEFDFGGAPCAGQSKKTLQKKRTSDLRTSLAKVAARTQRLIGAKQSPTATQATGSIPGVARGSNPDSLYHCVINADFDAQSVPPI